MMLMKAMEARKKAEVSISSESLRFSWFHSAVICRRAMSFYVMYNLICVHCSSRKINIRHKLKYRKFCSNVKKLFYLEGDWHRLPILRVLYVFERKHK